MKHSLRCEGCGKFISEWDVYQGNATQVKTPSHSGKTFEVKTTCRDCLDSSKAVGESLESV